MSRPNLEARFSQRSLLLLLPAAGLGVMLVGGCTEPLKPQDHWAQTYDSSRYGTKPEDVAANFNLHRGRWWNYYSRGCWYLELGDPKAAAADFRRALALRQKDGRDARTYGMHFWDYFPHRELGVALLRTGQTADAIRELQTSLDHAESARAKFYLNKARAAMLEQSGADKAPPVITVDPGAAEVLVNRTNVPIRAAITDDQYVSAVSVAGRELFVELASPRIDVDEEIELEPGRNRVEIKAADLVGHVGTLEVTVTVDVKPSVICVRRGAEQAADENVVVDLTAADDVGLREIRVGDRRVSCDGSKRKSVTCTEAKSEASRLSVAAVDLAGNVTTAVIDVSGQAPKPGQSELRRLVPVRLASQDWGGFPATLPPARVRQAVLLDGADSGGGRPLFGLAVHTAPRVGFTLAAAGASPAPRDNEPPRIDLRLPEDETLVTNLKRFFLDGRIYDPSGLSSLVVNGEAINVVDPKSDYIIFSHLVRLKPGLNSIQVVATDGAGNEASQTVRVEYQEPEPLSATARYALALMPLQERGTETGYADRAYDAILASLLDEPPRFRVLERDQENLKKIMREQGLAPLADQEAAIRVGKILSAEGMLLGGTDAGKTDFTITVRLVDTETTEVLFVADVCGDPRDPKGIRWYADGLVLKIKRHFPLVSGKVINVEEGMLYLDVGKAKALREGMRLLVFREEEKGPLRLLKPLKVRDRPVEAKVADVQPNGSSATLRDKEAASIVRIGDRVITK